MRKGKGEKMSFHTANFSGRGGRSYNEDSTFYIEKGQYYLAIVADGLGSYGGGEIASKIAVDVLSNCFLENPTIREDKINEYLYKANEVILKSQRNDCKMMTTVAALLAINQQPVFVHIGDSRVYYFRNGKIQYQSTDHSVSQMAVNSGDITSEQIRFHEDRNRLLRALGADGEIKAKIKVCLEPLQDNDAFLLCSDGFWEYILESEMVIDLSKSSDEKQWLSYMLSRLGKRVNGKNDNLSVIAIIYRKDT